MTTTKVHVGGVEHEIEADGEYVVCNGITLAGHPTHEEARRSVIGLERALRAAKPIENRSLDVDHHYQDDEEDDVGHEFKPGDRVRFKIAREATAVVQQLLPHQDSIGCSILVLTEDSKAGNTGRPDAIEPATPQPSPTAMRAAEEMAQCITQANGKRVLDEHVPAIARIIDEKMQPAMKVVEAADKMWQKSAYRPGTDTFETCHIDMVELRDALARLDGEESE